jgi:KipI family sensor histidine kinase inhibitor
MMGFLPGLPFLSELDPKLKLPRRSNPRTLVPSGSIGIAINQSVIYPQDSPGGWNIVGRTPVSIFDQRKENSILLSIGDRITFRRITAEEFEEIFNLNQKSHVQIKEIKI